MIPVKKFSDSSKTPNPVRFPNSRGIAPANYICANNLITDSRSADAIVILIDVSVRPCVIGNTTSLSHEYFVLALVCFSYLYINCYNLIRKVKKLLNVW